MIEEKYTHLCQMPSDINEHLPTLRRYAEQCDFIVELGVRKIVSTWAFLAGKSKRLISVDITHPKDYGGDLWEVEGAAREAGITFDFALKSSLDIDLPEHDLLFIDTLHTYEQLAAELNRHHKQARKFIIMHDTNLAGDPDNMRKAVNDFLDSHTEWEVAEHFDNNNGLTILKRV